MKLLFKILNFFIFFYSCECRKLEIIWENFRWNIQKKTSDYIYGNPYIYTRSKRIIGYQILNTSITNKICEAMGFSSFHSFSLQGRGENSQKYFFDLSKIPPKHI